MSLRVWSVSDVVANYISLIRLARGAIIEPISFKLIGMNCF